MVTLIVVRVSSSTAPAEAGGSTLNCHRLNHDEIKTKSAAVAAAAAAAATAAGNDEDEGYLGSLINRESQLKITKAKACTVTVAAARLSNIDDSDPYVDAASRRKRQPFRLCSAGGCTNQARAAGVCWSHGAKPPPILNVNLCSSARAALTPTAALKNEEDPGPGALALINKESQLKKAKACTVAAARPSNIYGSVPYHVLVDEVSQRKRQRSGSVGEDIVPKKTARMQHRKWSTATEARDGGMCIRYGAKVKPKKYSSEGEECTNNIDQNGGICKRHGAKVKPKKCNFEGCANQARSGGVCIRHGAKAKAKKCSSEGCTNFAQNGGVCWRHGAKAKAKKCSSVGCTNLALNGGVCKRHGAKVKLCINEGCTNQARARGGVCWSHRRHGAKVKLCSSEGCTK
jgi:hypothetical protein